MTTTTELLLTKFDIAPTWHETLPGIMDRFLVSFSAPVTIGGAFIGGTAYREGRAPVGLIVSLERRGDDLYGEVRWISSRPAGHVRMSWATGPGDTASLTSGFMDHWPHRTSWEVDDDDPCDDAGRGATMPEGWI